MIEALNSQATTIVTVGAPQTSHGRLTAAVAAKFGLKCIIVAVGDTDGELSGNLLLDGILAPASSSSMTMAATTTSSSKKRSRKSWPPN